MCDNMSEELETLVRRLMDSIADMQRQMERMFREVWKHIPGEYTAGFYEPPADIEDREDEYVIYVDLPGFNKDEIKIKVTEDFVEILAERSEERKREIASRNYIVRERVYEGFRKRIELPGKIRPELAKARLNNGVLEIHLPKSGAVREIEVSIE